MNDLNQYSRRNNIEIQNIPKDILQKDLEEYVIKVLHSIDITSDSYGIVAVHRLGKFRSDKNRVVIVRFLNRKNAYMCLNSAKKLARCQAEYRKLFITEHLCPTYRNLFNRLYKLNKQKRIYNVWTYEGKVFCKVTDKNDERPKIIKHQDDIDYYCVVEDSQPLNYIETRF